MVLNVPYLFITSRSVMSSRSRQLVDLLPRRRCFALRYLNAGWFRGCPNAVVTAPALWLLCNIDSSLSFPLFFLSKLRSLVQRKCDLIFKTVFWHLDVER